MTANVWIVLRDDAQALIIERLQWDTQASGEYTGPVPDRAHRIFQWMADHGSVQRLFKTVTIGGRQYKLWSVNVPASKTVKDEIDWLIATYPNQVIVAGAWNLDTGAQIGGYGIHPQLIKFMPDVWNGDIPPTFSTATVLTDVNLLLGQAPRDFS
jgi:hypothetical protein